MKKQKISSQQFIIKTENKVYGCSYRKAKYCELYYGKVSIYTKENWNSYTATEHEVYSNIYLGRENMEENLINYIKDNLLK